MCMAPVRRKEPRPCLLLLRRGKPTLPLCFPSFFAFTQRKKFENALSKSLKASWGAHLDTSYIQGYSVFLSELSCLCCSIAFELPPVFLYSSMRLANPQLKAKRAAPAWFA